MKTKKKLFMEHANAACIGRVVCIRQWDDMAREFGERAEEDSPNGEAELLCESGVFFCDEMIELCGLNGKIVGTRIPKKEELLESDDIKIQSNTKFLDIAGINFGANFSNNTKWNITPEMIEPLSYIAENVK